MMQKELHQTYSFSMVNLLQLIPAWDFHEFTTIMTRSGTDRVELVPSLLLGEDWDICEDLELMTPLKNLQSSHQVTSIQSLTYGLDLRLTDPIVDHASWQRRFHGLVRLGRALDCGLFVLGSPGQKKLDSALGNASKHRDRFAENCLEMAKLLGPDGVLCLEHNTCQQGAEYCNNLAAIDAVVAQLERAGIVNVGVNFDTKCLLQEFGVNLELSRILSDAPLASRIRTIQVSLDFLSRSCPHAKEDAGLLARFAEERGIPISLEEFGLRPDQLTPFVTAWQAVVASA